MTAAILALLTPFVLVGMLIVLDKLCSAIAAKGRRRAAGQGGALRRGKTKQSDSKESKRIASLKSGIILKDRCIYTGS